MAQQVWVQIEAHPTRTEAEGSAGNYARELSPLQGYQLNSGWYALAIGPLSPAEAPTVLRQLRVTRQIPGDSYLVDGSNFRGQFWPPDGFATAETAPVEVASAAPLVAGEETPAEARQSEALLTREERMELQSALGWEGYYNSAIDGAIGPGTRNAMSDWQIASGYEPTGVLTSAQRGELVGAYRAVLASIGMVPHDDPVAGIAIDLPLGMVAMDHYEPPFVHLAEKDNSGVRALLISQAGGHDTLAALYDVLQTLEIVPLDGDRNLYRNSFDITGENNRILTAIHVEIAGDDIKGYGLIWPAGGDLEKRKLVLSRMAESFHPIIGTVLPDDYGAVSRQSVDLLSGLAIRRPEFSRSGFYVSADGSLVTAADGTASCDRLTLGEDDIPLRVEATDLANGLALLKPQATLSPIGLAGIAAEMPRIGSDVAVSGYSFGRRLSEPSLTFGTLADIAGLNAEPDLRRLELPANPGDEGGPVMDASGAVLGLLLPASAGARVLPDGVHMALGAERLAAFLADHGIDPQPADARASYPPEDLAILAANMTVLVSCWN